MTFDEFRSLVQRDNEDRDFMPPLAKQTRAYAQRYFGQGTDPSSKRLLSLFQKAASDLGDHLDIREFSDPYESANSIKSRVNEWTRKRGSTEKALRIYYWLSFHAKDPSFAEKVTMEVMDSEVGTMMSSGKVKRPASKPSEKSRPFDLEGEKQIWDQLLGRNQISRATVRDIDEKYAIDSAWSIEEIVDLSASQDYAFQLMLTKALDQACAAFDVSRKAKKLKAKIISENSDKAALFHRIREPDLSQRQMFGGLETISLGEDDAGPVGISFYPSRDNWFGQLRGDSPNGLGVWQIYPRLDLDFSQTWSGLFQYNEAVKASYQFIDERSVLGAWEDQKPVLGLAVAERTHLYTLFLGKLGETKNEQGVSQWGPAGLGIAALNDGRLVLAEIKSGEITNPTELQVIASKKLSK